MNRYGPRLAIAIALGLAASSPGPAAADDLAQKQACVTASDAGQRLRDEGRLIDAEQQFIACAKAGCPGVVQSACSGWLDEVRAKIPTVVVAVKDAAGRDVVADEVTVDGARNPDAAQGRAVKLDPGPHEIRITHGGETRSVKVVVRERDRGRVVSVAFEAAEPAPPAPPAEEGISIWVPVLAGVGAVLLGTSAYLGLDAKSDADRLRDECAPNCPDSDVDPIRTQLVWGEIALAGSVISLGAAAVLLFSGGDSESDPPVDVGVAWGRAGGAATMRARF